jgi:uncharacterized protein YqjF (DUF2071 family)
MESENSQRQWPAPDSPWIMEQSWHDLLFMHWPVRPSELEPLVPAPLRVSTFHGVAWVGIIPFRMSGVRLRGTPALPWISAFPELNVRTYVTLEDKPGVWFFSLDAANALAVTAARRWFHLPYFRARMSCCDAGQATAYASERTHRGAPAAAFDASYKPVGEPFTAAPVTLEYFLTARYCLYAAYKGTTFRGEIDHPAWQLQKAEAEVAQNTMAAASGIKLPDEAPLLHFAQRQPVKIWNLQKVAL